MSVRNVLVLDGDVALAVRVHSPESPADEAQELPAVIVMGSWLTVKEQMPDLYAERLAPSAAAAASGQSCEQYPSPTWRWYPTRWVSKRQWPCQEPG